MPCTWAPRSVDMGRSLGSWVGRGPHAGSEMAWGSRPTGGSERGLAVGAALFQLVLVPGRVGILLADPVVALALELLDQFAPAALDDPAAEEDVDELGLDVVQDALIVGDDEDPGADP